MGNCMRSNGRGEPQEGKLEGQSGARATRRTRGKPADEERKRGGNDELKNGVVRVRVVMTQRELQQILSYRKSSKVSSVEQLVGALKLKSRGTGAREGGEKGCWRPSLGSIPEDHYN